MFRPYDIVKCQDGRSGIINSIFNETQVIIQFGAAGLFKFHKKETLCFTESEYLETCGGRNFFKKANA